MREKEKLPASDLSPDRMAAIRRAATITRAILDKRADIVAVLLARRVQSETFEAIAKNKQVASLLADVGATTHAMRVTVACQVCAATLQESFRKRINHNVLSNRPYHATPAWLAARAKMRLYNWTDGTNAFLLQLEQTLLWEEGPRKGRSHWQNIAQTMRDRFQINLSPDQWRSHAWHVKSCVGRKKNAKTNKRKKISKAPAPAAAPAHSRNSGRSRK